MAKRRRTEKKMEVQDREANRRAGVWVGSRRRGKSRGFRRVGDEERDLKKNGGKGESELACIRELKPRCHMKRQDKTNDTVMDFSLSFYFSFSLPLFSPIPASLVNVTSLDAFHSPLAVPARRYSVKPIYIRKWPFSCLSSPSLPPSPPLFPPLATIHLF